MCLLSIAACGGGRSTTTTQADKQVAAGERSDQFRLVETLPLRPAAFYDAKNPSAYAAIVDSQKIAKELARKAWMSPDHASFLQMINIGSMAKHSYRMGRMRMLLHGLF